MNNIIKDQYGNYIIFSKAPPKTGNKYKADVYDADARLIASSLFGSAYYEQYKDRTPLKLWSNFDHLDENRRRRYRQRHSKILLKDGRPAYTVPYTPAYFSYYYLW